MNFKSLFSILVILSFASLLHAQLEKTIHQTFDLNSTNQISYDLIADTTIIVPWAGNNILTETKIELYDASPSILKHYIKVENRYEIEVDTTANNIKLFSTQKERKPIRTRSGECPEIVQIKLFVPEDFQIQDNHTLVRSN